MHFKDIPQFPLASYRVTIPWAYLQSWIDRQNEDSQLEMNPKYQRGHVWTKLQKIAYVEYQLRGGFSGRDIFWNCPTWMSVRHTQEAVELVNGKQRIDAVLDFLNSRIKAFDTHYKNFDGKLVMDPHLTFHINNLKSRLETVNWYLSMNTGGSIHTKKDLEPAYKLIKDLESLNR